MADCLVDCFSSVFVRGLLPDPHPHQRADTLFVFKEFTVNDVMVALNKTKLSPSCGPDGLPVLCSGSVPQHYVTLCVLSPAKAFHLCRSLLSGILLMLRLFLKVVHILVLLITGL